MSDRPIKSGSANLLDRLRESACKCEEIPKGWKTSMEWAKEFKLSPPQTRRLLRKGLEDGVVEKKGFRSRLENGKVTIKPFYKEV